MVYRLGEKKRERERRGGAFNSVIMCFNFFYQRKKRGEKKPR